MSWAKNLIYFLVRSEGYFLLALIFRIFAIRRRFPDGTQKLAWPVFRTKNQIAVLALGAEGFREDLTFLAKGPNVRVYTIHRKWQYVLTFALYSETVARKPGIVVRHYQCDNDRDAELFALKKTSQQFYRGFLRYLYCFLPVQIVLTYNNRFLADLDWAEVGRGFGVRSVCLFREIPTIIESDIAITKDRLKAFGTFTGDKIIVATEATKACFVEPGFANENQVSVCGVPRMDRLFGMLNRERKASSRSQVIMFWWSITLYDSPEWRELCDRSLRQFIDVARKTPTVDFIIKPKPVNLRSLDIVGSRNPKSSMVMQPKANPAELPLRSILNEVYPNWEAVGNFKLLPNEDVHNLIEHASLVCGFQSITLFEAAYVGLPVIVPYFNCFSKTQEGQKYAFKRFLPLFDVAEDENQFEQFILNGIKNPCIEPDQQLLRREIFEQEISVMDGYSTARVLETFCSVIDLRDG